MTPNHNENTDATVGDATTESQVGFRDRIEDTLKEVYQVHQDGQNRYHQTAVILSVLGLIAAVGGMLFPAQRDLLFALAAVGLFGGVLTYVLTIDQFVSATTAERIYRSAATNSASFANRYASQANLVYVPTDDDRSAKLVLSSESDDPPSSERRVERSTEIGGDPFVLEPMGAGLFEEFSDVLVGDVASDPHRLAVQLAEGLADHFELVGSATADVDSSSSRVTFRVTDSALGPVDQFDHPVQSFLAVGFAVGLGRPIKLKVEQGADPETWVISCLWSGSPTE